jgi:hypothetical protein
MIRRVAPPDDPPARRALSRALDALQALLAALTHRNQLGHDLPAASDRQADAIGFACLGAFVTPLCPTSRASKGQ